MTYEPLRMTYYALFSLLHARRSPSYCSTEKHWGLLKNARSLVAMCIPRWQGKAGRNEMQVSLEAFSLQKYFCKVPSSYISYLIMRVWRMQMCRNINVGKNNTLDNIVFYNYYFLILQMFYIYPFFLILRIYFTFTRNSYH